MEEGSSKLNARETWKPMEGEVTEKSERGKDTIFKRCLKAADPEIVPVSDHRKSQRGIETLLVIEDDDSVREFTVRTLKTYGYNVLSATDGQTALELFKSPAPQIDMVITDIVMPNMTGTQFVKVIHQFNMDMKILFVSGYNLADTADGVAFNHRIAFLEKPYTGEQLAKKIRDVLDGMKP
jgi:CheY-like chemotaxis protein